MSPKNKNSIDNIELPDAFIINNVNNGFPNDFFCKKSSNKSIKLNNLS